MSANAPSRTLTEGREPASAGREPPGSTAARPDDEATGAAPAVPARPHVAEPPFGEQSLALAVRGYRALGAAFARYGGDAFAGRLGFTRTLFLRGREGARLFYDDSRLTRAGAVPGIVKHTLFGHGTVHGFDDAEHRHRKAVFNRLADHAGAVTLADLADAHWAAAARDWRGDVVLFDAAVDVLGHAVCAWAGVPPRTDVGVRVRDMAAIVAGFGSLGVGQFRARLARRRTTAWARTLIRAVRAERLRPPKGSALDVWARHRDLDGRLLPERTAADEFVNVLRPTIAVSWFVVFAALALHRHPEWRAPVAAGDAQTLYTFAQEVRRRYPFAPVLAARARRPFTWREHRVERGRRVILDLYGTDHDPARWPDPDRFAPERFDGPAPGAYDLVPQGGGDAEHGHRCPGEGFTLALLTRAARFLARLDYTVPPQDLRFSHARVPTLPRSGFVLRTSQAYAARASTA